LRGEENRLVMRKKRAPARKLQAEGSGTSQKLQVDLDPHPIRLKEAEQKLALSEQVLGAMAQELCAQIAHSHHQQEEVDIRITAQVALMDARERRLIVANAGHCPMLLVDARGQARAISPEGMPLGIVPDAAFAEEIASIEKPGCALFYTDGLTDARNPQ